MSGMARNPFSLKSGISIGKKREVNDPSKAARHGHD